MRLSCPKRRDSHELNTASVPVKDIPHSRTPPGWVRPRAGEYWEVLTAADGIRRLEHLRAASDVLGGRGSRSAWSGMGQ
jgi:hypothetical protein